MKNEIIDIQSNLKKGIFSNEASVSQGIVQRILSILGWPVYNTSIVIPEYSVGSKRVDFALCHPANKPVVFIEIKQVGHSDGAEGQLFEYAYFQGIPLAILTDGQEWQIFIPGEQGGINERRVYKLDFLERDVEVIEKILRRYLAYDRVLSGKAIAAARDDYRSNRKMREIEEKIPDAWDRLVDEGDELLVELISDKVESLCGYKPEPDVIMKFLQEKVFLLKKEPIIDRKSQIRVPNKYPSQNVVKVISSGNIRFIYKRRNISAASGRDMMLQVMNLLADEDSSFLERFANLPQHGRTRRYLSKDRAALNPKRPDLALNHEFSKELRPGWWMNVNISSRTIKKILIMACQVAGIEFGKDIIVQLPNT